MGIKKLQLNFLCEQIKQYINIFMLSKSKLDDSFPLGQFLIDGFHAPFRFDRDKSREGIMLYIREDIPARVLSHNVPSAESFFIEIIFITLHKVKTDQSLRNKEAFAYLQN